MLWLARNPPEIGGFFTATASERPDAGVPPVAAVVPSGTQDPADMGRGLTISPRYTWIYLFSEKKTWKNREGMDNTKRLGSHCDAETEG